jgi:hypothetical protein
VKSAIIVALAAVLAGCAAPHYIYERRSATPAQLERDLESCQRQGFRPQRFALIRAHRYDWDVVNRCMERKGYGVRPADD